MAPPLRPAPSDVAMFEATLAEHARPGTMLLLGVTPEIAGMRWPEGSTLLAVDRCMGMIQGVWPCDGIADRNVSCGDWMSLPVADASVTAVIGDGCYTLLPFPQGHATALAEVARVLTPGGLFVMRYFCRPETLEPLDAVIADLEAGAIGNFHILKWRLAMALHGAADEGVSVGAVWEAFEAAVDDRDALAERTGWPRASIDTIDVYRGVETPYFFPTLDEVHSITSEHFEAVGVDVPDYELGERCPTVIYRKLA